MKKIFLILIACAGLTACDNNVPELPDDMKMACVNVGQYNNVNSISHCINADADLECYVFYRTGVYCRGI